MSGNDVVHEHPDSGHPIAGVAVPHWEYILESASRAADITGLGYLGVDIVLDRHLGPLMLELNARPGLNIQLANRRGLQPRLLTVEREAPVGAAVGERVAFARARFSHAATAVV